MSSSVAQIRHFCCVVASMGLLSGCSLLDQCGLPGHTTSLYNGELGRAAAGEGAAETDTNVVTITVIATDGGTIEEAMLTLARPGLRQFGDSMHVHDRSSGDRLLETGYGYYRADSLVYRANAFPRTLRGGDLATAIARNRVYFELHSRAGVDTAALGLVSRQHSKGVCT